MKNERHRGPWDMPTKESEALAAKNRFVALVILPGSALNCLVGVTGVVLAFKGVAEGKVEEALGGMALLAGSYAGTKVLLNAGRARGIEEFVEAADAVDEILKD